MNHEFHLRSCVHRSVWLQKIETAEGSHHSGLMVFCGCLTSIWKRYFGCSLDTAVGRVVSTGDGTHGDTLAAREVPKTRGEELKARGEEARGKELEARGEAIFSNSQLFICAVFPFFY